ncbi:unnamed protein product [Dibothriocephalus latus]|uniref:Uncharacterized protein n=1 Tax=Dibothriocephalus latus TaxID=60516 RepID=A0A3P7LTA7_DIBLA|nr:unnamed protein product [Dibothriocephalus latus]
MRRKAYDAARRLSFAASSPLPTLQDKGTLFSTPSSSSSSISRPIFKGVKHLPGKDGTPSAAARRLRDSQAQAQRRRATRSVAADKRRGLL